MGLWGVLRARGLKPPRGTGPDWAEERARQAEREERSTLTLRAPVGPRGSTVRPQRRVCAAREKLIQTIDRFLEQAASSQYPVASKTRRLATTRWGRKWGRPARRPRSQATLPIIHIPHPASRMARLKPLEHGDLSMDQGIRASMAALTASTPGVAAGQARFGTPFRLSLLGPGTLQSPESERDERPDDGRAPGVLDGGPFSYGAGQLLSHTLPAYVPEGTPRVIGDIPRGRHSGKWPGNMVRTRPWAANGSPEMARRHVRPAGGCAMMETRPGSSRRSGPPQRSPGPRRHGNEDGGDGRKAYVVDAGGRTGQSYRGLKKVPRVLPPRAARRAVYGRCRDGSMLRRLCRRSRVGGGACRPSQRARMAMSGFGFPCRCQATAARRRRSSGACVVVQVNCSEASRVGDGTRREAAVTARRDSWRVSRSTAVEIPMGHGRLGGSWGQRVEGRAFTDVTWSRLQERWHFHFQRMLWKCQQQPAGP
jgi:hypothetical protein